MGVDVQLFVQTPGALDAEQVRRWSFELAEAVGHQHFWLSEKSDQHALRIVGEDGYPRRAYGLTGHLLQVHQLWRYYGPGYERGDFPTILATVTWLQARIPECRVFYGGDSGEHLDEIDLPQLVTHWVHNGGTPYYGYFGRARDLTPPDCPFCRAQMTLGGGGQGDTFWRCNGCGKKALTTAEGQTAFSAEKNEDWGALRKRADGT